MAPMGAEAGEQELQGAQGGGVLARPQLVQQLRGGVGLGVLNCHPVLFKNTPPHIPFFTCSNTRLSMLTFEGPSLGPT